MMAKKIWESISDGANCWGNLSSEERETLELVAGIAYRMGREDRVDFPTEKIVDHRKSEWLANRVVILECALECVKENTLNPEHTMTKQGLEESIDACHSIASAYI